MGALWHGFADMGAVASAGAFVVSRGEGAYIYDDKGTRYLDATAGLWFTNVGYGRTEIGDAVAAQIAKLGHYSNFGDLTSDTTVELAERLSAIAPVSNSKIFFTLGGSDSIDTAAKIARRYWTVVGQPEKTLLVGRQKAYHGMHWAGTSLGGIPPNREGYGELMPEARTITWDEPAALRALIEAEGAHRIAAFFAEPIIGAGGIYLPPENYLTEVRQICRENDILFVADEVVTGFGRIGGSWFASTRFGLEPDLMTTAKGLTSGYLPMGAVFAAPRVADPFFAGGNWLRHGYTYGGHAASAAAALANLDIMEREDLLVESKRLESTLHEKLQPLADHPAVVEVRSGLGAVAGIQLEDVPTALGFVKTLRRHGVSTRACGVGALQISPSFVMTDIQVDELTSRIGDALTEL